MITPLIALTLAVGLPFDQSTANAERIADDLTAAADELTAMAMAATALADMEQAAQTPEDRAFVAADRKLWSDIEGLITRRSELRARIGIGTPDDARAAQSAMLLVEAALAAKLLRLKQHQPADPGAISAGVKAGHTDLVKATADIR